MATTVNIPFFLIMLLLLSSGAWATTEELQHVPEPGRQTEQQQQQKQQTFPSTYISSSNGRKLFKLGIKLEDDSMNTPDTNLPSNTPITNPANFPPYTPTPTIVTVPGTTPQNPIPTPITTVPTTTTTPFQPITNPANPDPTTTYPTPATGGGFPATGGNTPAGIPVTTPPTEPMGNAPVTAGQSWCIAKAGVPESALQDGLDYACGIGGADCSVIQEGGSCYNPNTLENHASYAFNSYFQKDPVATSCDFGGSAVIVNTNPSTGTCIYPSSATQVATPTGVPTSTVPPGTTGVPSLTFPPATTDSSSGATGAPPGFAGYGGAISPPSVFNPDNPTSGNPAIYGPDSPPTGNSVPAGSTALQPFIGFIVLVASFSTGKLIFSS